MNYTCCNAAMMNNPGRSEKICFPSTTINQSCRHLQARSNMCTQLFSSRDNCFRNIFFHFNNNYSFISLICSGPIFIARKKTSNGFKCEFSLGFVGSRRRKKFRCRKDLPIHCSSTSELVLLCLWYLSVGIFICLLIKYQKYKSVELGDQLIH